MTLSLGHLDAKRYVPHPLHGTDRDFAESNCYVDLYVEVLHGLGLDPYPCLPFTFVSDFEGDQWTFFKPSLADLDALYGIEVQELTLYKPLVDHVECQLSLGSLVAPEVDAFFLPDVASTDYRQNHVKTTIAIAKIDRKAQRLEYFHNRGFFELEGEDFNGLFGIDAPRRPTHLPPYTELIKLGRAKKVPSDELKKTSFRLLSHYLDRRPPDNPFRRYAERIEAHTAELLEQDVESYHAYVFATLRQAGACFEFSSRYLNWLTGGQELGAPFASISTSAKSLIMQLARVVHTKRRRPLRDRVLQMADAYDTGMQDLDRHLDRGG